MRGRSKFSSCCAHITFSRSRNGNLNAGYKQNLQNRSSSIQNYKQMAEGIASSSSSQRLLLRRRTAPVTTSSPDLGGPPPRAAPRAQQTILAQPTDLADSWSRCSLLSCWTPSSMTHLARRTPSSPPASPDAAKTTLLRAARNQGDQWIRLRGWNGKRADFLDRGRVDSPVREGLKCKPYLTCDVPTYTVALLFY
jgi:hypothetical protein